MMIDVEVVYALAEQQHLVALCLPNGSTVGDALQQSGFLDQYDDLIIDQLSLGVHSKPVQLDAVLAMHDRVEIYRPLRIDPKMARRLRAQRALRQKSKK